MGPNDFEVDLRVTIPDCTFSDMAEILHGFHQLATAMAEAKNLESGRAGALAGRMWWWSWVESHAGPQHREPAPDGLHAPEPTTSQQRSTSSSRPSWRTGS